MQRKPSVTLSRVAASLGLALFAIQDAAVAEQPMLPKMSLAAEALESFLASHTGPVLHVSFDHDCRQTLKQTTHRIPIDDDFTDAEMRYEAAEMFVADVKATAAMAEALQQARLVLVVCCAGVRSAAAAAALARHGFNVVTVTGGVSSAKLPKRLLNSP